MIGRNFNIPLAEEIINGKRKGKFIWNYYDDIEVEILDLESKVIPYYPIQGKLIGDYDKDILEEIHYWNDYGCYFDLDSVDECSKDLSVYLYELEEDPLARFKDGDIVCISGFDRYSNKKAEVFKICVFKNYISEFNNVMGDLLIGCYPTILYRTKSDGIYYRNSINSESKGCCFDPYTETIDYANEEEIKALFRSCKKVLCRFSPSEDWKENTLLGIDKDGDFECENGITYPYCAPL